MQCKRKTETETQQGQQANRIYGWTKADTITNDSSLVKATKLLARFGSGLALEKPLASSGVELTLHKLLANVGGASALD